MCRYVDMFVPPDDGAKRKWLVFHGNTELLVPDGEVSGLVGEDVACACGVEEDQGAFLGTLDGVPVWVGFADSAEEVPEGMDFVRLREFIGTMDETEHALAGRAWQILHWRITHRFCGVCGGPMRHREDERALQCPACGNLVYPRISPAVITAVTRNGRLLLAHNHQFPAGMYSLIAGYVEVGETLKDAVRREIREEVSIEVKNIRYFGSQPWPYPSGLMLGFTAEHASGELVEDGDEIEHADWFLPDNMPTFPRPGSISRELIDDFRDRAGGAE